MAVQIRLQRKGAKKNPYYKVVVLDKAKKRDGGCIEMIGDYHPEQTELSKKFFINKERLAYWIGKGAKTSDTVGQLAKANAKL